MPDKKLTDNEIPNVKELLEYKVKAHCELCDIKSSECCSVCLYTAIKQFIELFNRLQAENEKLFADNQKYLSVMLWGNKKNVKNLLNQIKAEAYKECIEKVKKLRGNYTGYAFDKKLNNLFEELVGGTNES